MRTNWSVKFLGLGMAVIVAGLAQTPPVLGQTYYYNGPVGAWQGKGNGFQEIPVADVANPLLGNYWDGNGNGLYPGAEPEISFGTLNGAITYDSLAGTVRFAGNVGVNNGSFNFSFNDNQMANPVNGSYVPATVTVNCNLANVNNHCLSFDTGTVGQAIGAPGSWNLNFQLPISGTYSLSTGGKAYIGSFDYTLSLNVVMHIPSVNSTSLTFYQDTEPDSEFLNVPLAQATADNGVSMNLYAQDPEDGATYQSWHIENAVAVVPEPGTWAMLGCGCAGLALAGRKRKA